MSQEQTRSLMLVVLGAMAVWLWRSGQALNYVRPGLVPLVGAAGLVLLAGGLLPPLGLLGTGRAGHRPDSLGDQDLHHHGSRVGWLLLVPVLVVMLIQPAALGSYAVSSRTVVPGSGGNGQFPPLDAPVRGAVPMSMAEFVTRAVRDPGQSLAGVRVRLTGFVAPAEHDQGGSYRLTRFVIFCCAADAEALQAVVRGDQVPRARDQWLEIEGTWQPRPADVDNPSPPPPVLNADVVRPIAPPRPPYEYSMQFSG
ncbi:MAG TPA: TIGR03943 family protein [Actinomycetota bacterium]|nr:TIGR03943 family protein [Actinomycetota bacterium]